MGVRDCGFVDGEDGAWNSGGGRTVDWVGRRGGFCGRGWVDVRGLGRCGLWRKLDVDAPAAADAFDVKTFAEDANLAP